MTDKSCGWTCGLVGQRSESLMSGYESAAGCRKLINSVSTISLNSKFCYEIFQLYFARQRLLSIPYSSVL